MIWQINEYHEFVSGLLKISDSRLLYFCLFNLKIISDNVLHPDLKARLYLWELVRNGKRIENGKLLKRR